jgi:hypothetical protein
MCESILRNAKYVLAGRVASEAPLLVAKELAGRIVDMV